MRRAWLFAGAIAVAVVGLPGAAFAHVSVNPGEASQGGFTKLTFRVPNERPDAGTTGVEVNFPTDHPLQFVSVQPVPGWEYEVTRSALDTPIETDEGEVTEAVSKITWSGGRVGPGEFQEFSVSVGPLPDDTDALAFPAVQTYDSGEVVRWIEEAGADGEEPEHPVPVLTLVAGSGDEHGATATTVAGDETEAAPDAVDGDGDDESETDALAVAALVVGILALVVGGAALLRGRGART